MTSTDTYQLKWHSHSSHLNGSVASLLRSEKFTDVVLCTMDGSQIPAHKFILSSCSVYLCQLFEGQRSVTRMGGLLYVVLPSEISTKALKILVEYMYKGETTVSNEVLDTVLKAGEVLKIRGLWRQMDDSQTENTNAEKPPNTVNVLNKQAVSALKKQQETEVPVKIASKKDEKAIKVIAPVQGTQGQTRPMFIGPPKLVFIKTADGSGQIRPLTPKGQTIIVTPDINKGQNSDSGKSTNQSDKDSSDDVSVPRVVRKPEKKYGKRARIEKPSDQDENAKSEGNKSDDSSQKEAEKHEVKEEPEWDASSIEEEERSIAEMFQAEMTIKTEPADDVDIEEETLMYSPLTCELCAEVFTVPGSWVRHVEEHARTGTSFRRRRSSSEETEEMALLRCDLCKKHFPNPALWVRHIQSIHTDKELAIYNNSSPSKRHNRFTDGVQNKTCPDCNKEFPSHASMLIHLRTHTGERPYVCGLCNKGFNVKSNLLRHLRTLHDRLSPECGTDEAETSIGGGSSNEA